MRMIADQDERDLAALARDVLASSWPTTAVRAARAPDADGRALDGTWSALARAGLLGLAVPVEQGGSGGTVTDLGVLAVEAGRALAPTLLHGTHLLGLAVDVLGDDDQRTRVLPALAAGELRGTTGLVNPYDAGDLTPSFTLDRGTVRGTSGFVPDADLADLLLVPARRGAEVVAVLVPAGRVRVTPQAVMGDRRYAEIAVDDVEVADDDVLPLPPDAHRRLVNLGLTLLSLDLVGVGLAALDRTVSHTRQREQFGRPIASFQAAQHLVADMHLAVHAARLAGHAAMARLRDGRLATRETAVARMHAAAAATRATLDAHQLHGGMGYVLETDLHLWSERARVLATMGGGPDEAATWLAGTWEES